MATTLYYIYFIEVNLKALEDQIHGVDYNMLATLWAEIYTAQKKAWIPVYLTHHNHGWVKHLSKQALDVWAESSCKIRITQRGEYDTKQRSKFYNLLQ